MKLGEKGKRNKKINANLKKQFIESDLPRTCELRLPGCVGSQPPLDWAHSTRRSGWKKTDTDKHSLAAFVCRPCHRTSDAMPDHGERVILEAIARRGTVWIEPA